MQDTFPFDGFEILIKQPLEYSDPRSLNFITRLFIEDPESRNAPFSFLIKKLCGKTCSEPASKSHWQKILVNKKDMAAKLGRRVDIQTAAVDYFTLDGMEGEGADGRVSKPAGTPIQHDEWLDRIYTPSFYMEKLKEEVLRAKRYNHALSVIMLDIDDFSRINEQYSFHVGDEILALIVKIIRKSIRNVDIISRYAGDIFLIILPNTNRREAVELAERIRMNIPKRTKRMLKSNEEITATMSVAQCGFDETSADFIKRLESTLEEGKMKIRGSVFTA